MNGAASSLKFPKDSLNLVLSPSIFYHQEKQYLKKKGKNSQSRDISKDMNMSDPENSYFTDKSRDNFDSEQPDFGTTTNNLNFNRFIYIFNYFTSKAF
jgi:hypothetical protein